MATLLATLDALLATCRATGGGAVFTSANSSRDDWQVIDAADLGLVVEMGGETVEGDRVDGYGSHGAYVERHQLRVTVTIQVATGASGVSALIATLLAAVEGLKDHLRANRRLGLAFVHDLVPSRTSPVLERVVRRGEAPSHLLQQITITVWCESEL